MNRKIRMSNVAVWLASIVGLLLLSNASTALAQPDGFKTLEIGDAAPAFDLPGIDDKNHSLDDFADADVLMIVFTCNHCPTAQAYEDRLNKLYDDYHDKGVAIVAISPNDPLAVRLDELGYSDVGDTLEDMKIRAKDIGVEFPYLYDGETQKTSLEYGVIATPHVFIFDKPVLPSILPSAVLPLLVIRMVYVSVLPEALATLSLRKRNPSAPLYFSTK